MTTIINIKKTSLLLFLITGILHLGSSLLIFNNLYLREADIINKIIDIPFALTGLIYLGSCLRLKISHSQNINTKVDMAIFSVIMLILLILLTIHIFVPDFT